MKKKKEFLILNSKEGLHNTQHNGVQNNDTQHKENQYNDVQYNNKKCGISIMTVYAYSVCCYAQFHSM